MSIDALKQEFSSLRDAIEPYRKLVEHKFEELVAADNAFLELANRTANTDRELRIAVVGQVKAGKSSFLNALLFDGDEVLPKAITPKTAALTIICHGDSPRAVVEFYDADEWQVFLDNEKRYHTWIAEERERLLKAQAEDTGGLLRRRKISPEELNDAYFHDKAPEEYKAAHELVSQVRGSGISVQNLLGTEKDIAATDPLELSRQLNDYVGVDGRYTPLVRCSYLFYNLPQLDGFEIVDTPGLNDPVLSRGRMTKKFLARCDVAFMLSFARQFLDQSDMNLLHEQLPEAGVKDVIIVGSKFDMLLKGECRKHKDIGTLLDNLELDLRRRAEQEFRRRLQNAGSEHETRLYAGILQSFEKFPVPFISAMAYAAARHFTAPSTEEQRIIDDLNSLYPDTVFDVENLIDFSNMGEETSIRKALAGKFADKQRIMVEKMGAFLAGQRSSLERIRKEIREETGRSRERLRSGDINTLEERSRQISSRLKNGQGKIELAFEEGICGIKRKLALLITDIKELSTRFSRLDVKSESKVEEYEVKTSSWTNLWGFCPWGYETRSRTITYHYADAHEAISQVEEYLFKAEKKLKQAICELIDTTTLKKDIQEALIKLFDLGDPNLDAENDIRIPVCRAIAKITVPEVELGNSDYTKEITSKFSGGRVCESKIETLHTAQKNAISAVLKSFEAAVSKEQTRVVAILGKTQREFIDDLTKDIVTDLDKLKKELKERENNLKRYDELLAVLG